MHKIVDGDEAMEVVNRLRTFMAEVIDLGPLDQFNIAQYLVLDLTLDSEVVGGTPMANLAAFYAEMAEREAKARAEH